MDAAGVVVDLVCRGGYLISDDQSANLDESLQAIDEAADLGARALVVVAGPVTSTFDEAHNRTIEAIGELVSAAERRGIVLALEPFHPMLAAERSSVIDLRTANDIVEHFPSSVVQLAVDSYHLWWDPELDAQLARAADRIAVVQIAAGWYQRPTCSVVVGFPGKASFPSATSSTRSSGPATEAPSR